MQHFEAGEAEEKEAKLNNSIFQLLMAAGAAEREREMAIQGKCIWARKNYNRQTSLYEAIEFITEFHLLWKSGKLKTREN